MSAERHSRDANDEALRLNLAIEDLNVQLGLGRAVTSEQLTALLRSSVGVRYHTARTMHAVAIFPAPERRSPTIAAPVGDIPTPLAALEALLAECELTLDYRPSFRHAMSNANCAIVNAKNPRPVLHGTIELGESIVDDCGLTLEELFDVPAATAFEPQVLSIARGMAATDGAISVEAA